MAFAFWKKRRRHHETEINPDEIFLDASNLPEFDTQQFEGRIETPLTKRALWLLAIGFACIGVVVVGQAARLQIAEGSHYAALSKENRLSHSPVFARRGVIYDRTGTTLVSNMATKQHDFALREYPETPGLGHVLGYVGYPAKDKNGVYYQKRITGKAGIEEAYNERLRGDNGLKIVERDALMNVRTQNVVQPPEDGEAVRLTIDAELQSQLYTKIKDTAKRIGYNGGAGVIMNVHNGNVLAMTSYPEYDPTVLSLGDLVEQIQQYQHSKHTPFLNRVLSGLYAPGSIVKPFIATAALEEGIISPEKEILSTGSISIPNPYHPERETVFTDWKEHGWVDMREAIAVSSNVYFYEIGGGYEEQEGLGIQNIAEYMHRFDIGQKTGIRLGNEKDGLVPTPSWKRERFDGEPWRIGDTYNTAIGQYGFQVTPIQMVRATAAIANNGVLVTPVLAQYRSPQKHTLSLQPEHLQVVREGMRRAVTDGTASGLSVGYVEVAAKTGTAEVGEKGVNSWIIGFFPYEEPRYAFSVVMERGPKDTQIGGVYVMRQMLDWMHQNAERYLTAPEEQ